MDICDKDLKELKESLLNLVDILNKFIPNVQTDFLSNGEDKCYKSTFIMPYGKYKGQMVKDIPKSYAEWIIKSKKPGKSDKLVRTFESMYPNE